MFFGVGRPGGRPPTDPSSAVLFPDHPIAHPHFRSANHVPAKSSPMYSMFLPMKLYSGHFSLLSDNIHSLFCLEHSEFPFGDSHTLCLCGIGGADLSPFLWSQ